jgi:hypothetical protein
MAPQYEEGPEARSMESGFALDELLRREKSAATQQARQLGVAQAQQAEQHKNRLAEMLYGEQLKEKQAQAEADRGAPALQALMSGNPEVARVFGYEPGKPAVPGQLNQPVNPDEDPEAAAFIPRTPGSPAVASRMPTREEAAGLNRAIPGIAQAILTKRLEANKGPMVVSRGAGVFDPNTKTWIAEPQESGTFATPDEAIADRKRMEAAYPELVGRSQTMQDATTGRWRNQFMQTEPLSAQDPLKIGYHERVKAGMDPNKALDWYINAQATAAGQKALQINLNTPPTPGQQQEDRKTRETVSAFDNLQRMHDTAPALIREFLSSKGTAAELYEKLNRIPGAQALVSGLGQTEFVERYNDWKANLGRIQGKVFDEGGKQLTPFEASVVYMSTPKADDSPQSYDAKMKWMGSYMKAQQAFTYWLRTNPKIAQNPEAQAQAWRDIQRNAGIDMSDTYNWKQKLGSPSERAKSKLPGRQP